LPYIHSQRNQQIPLDWRLREISEPIGSDGCSVTGLPGLSHFYEAGSRRVEQCIAQGVPCAVALVEIDHLYRISEGYGYVADCLLEVGQTHLVARLGDEDFALLLIGLDGEASAACCEQLRSKIASSVVRAGAHAINITISAGVAGIEELETFDNYLNGAEQFLFMAKNNGRNQVYSDHLIASCSETRF
jgi:diguanylate cyclase